MRLRVLLVSSAVCLSACVVRFIDPDEDGPSPEPVHEAQPVVGQPPPPGAPAMMTREEAAHAALGYAQSQGYGARLKKVRWHEGRYWRVDVEVWRADARGKMRLEYDAWARSLAHTDVKVRDRRHVRDDDDDDDD